MDVTSKTFSSFCLCLGILTSTILVTAPMALASSEVTTAEQSTSTLDEEQRALLNLLDGLVEEIKLLLKHVNDPAHVATTEAVIDGLVARRHELVSGGFDTTNYGDLKFDVIVEYQRLAAWLKLSGVDPVKLRAETRPPVAELTESTREATTAEAVPQQTGTEILDRMEELNIAFRRLRRQVNNPARNQDSLAHVQVMRENAEESMKHIPAKAEVLPEVEKTSFVSDYRAELASLILEIDRLEAALKAGDNATAQRILAGFKKIQKRGHDKFREE